MRQTPQPPAAGDGEPGGLNVHLDVQQEHEWRVQQLHAAGFTSFAAFRLSVSGADWHEAVRLLRSGAPEHLIVEILI